MEIEPYKIFKSCNKQQKISHFNVSVLIKDEEKRDKYQNRIKESLEGTDSQNKWEDIQNIIKTSAKETIGIQINHRNNRIHDPEVEVLSEKQQKRLRIEISNTDVVEEIRSLQIERNAILHQISNMLNIAKR